MFRHDPCDVCNDFDEWEPLDADPTEAEPEAEPEERHQYAALSEVFTDAIKQAAEGKGRERHANGQPFERQLICEGARTFGIGAPLFQATKKINEAVRLFSMPNDKYTGPERAEHELLGAMVYCAAAVIRLRELK